MPRSPPFMILTAAQGIWVSISQARGGRESITWEPQHYAWSGAGAKKISTVASEAFVSLYTPKSIRVLS